MSKSQTKSRKKKQRRFAKKATLKSNKVNNTRTHTAWSELLKEILNAEDDTDYRGERNIRVRGDYEDVDVSAGCYPEMPRLMYMIGEQEDRLFSVNKEDALLPPLFFATAKEHGVLIGTDGGCTINAIRDIRYGDIPYDYRKLTKKYEYKKLSHWKRNFSGYDHNVGTIIVNNKGTWERLKLKNPDALPCQDPVVNDKLVAETSMVEDILCTGFVAFQHVRFGLTGVIPADEDARDELAKIRDTPVTKTGRRRPIQHFVRKHLRRTQKYGVVEVRSHTRGIEVYDIDDWRILTMVPLATLYQRSPEYGMAHAGKALAMMGCRPGKATADAFEYLARRGATLDKLQEDMQKRGQEEGAKEMGVPRFAFTKEWLKTCADLQRRHIRSLDQVLQSGYHKKVTIG